jgi:hypothetical protein
MDDYSVLQVLNEDLELYQKKLQTEAPYDFPGATDEERGELVRLDKDGELDGNDLISLEEFKAAMRQWRMKY